MKTFILTTIAPILLNLCAAAGGMPVVDAMAIASQRLAAQRDLIEQILQEANQQTQIARTLEQLSQFDGYLKKFGDPDAVRDLAGWEELHRQLDAKPVIKDPVLTPVDLEEDSVFRSMESKLAPKLEKEITVGGKVEALRDGGIYLPEVAERRTQEDYEKVRVSAMPRQEKLRQAIAGNLIQLKQAGTASEVQKLQAVLQGLQTELQAVTSEVATAAGDVQVRAQANATETAIQRKAMIEQERINLRVAARKEAATFKLFTNPVYFSK